MRAEPTGKEECAGLVTHAELKVFVHRITHAPLVVM